MPTYVVIDDSEIAAENPVTVSLMTRLRDNALAYAGAATGTRAMWQQTSAPLGWTKESLYNDYVPRVVTGSAGVGGSVAFSTLFGRTATDAVTLAQSKLPSVNLTTTISAGAGSHGHSASGSPNGVTGVPGVGIQGGSSAQLSGITVSVGSNTLPQMTGNTPLGGSGDSFTAPIDMRCKYVDNIIAEKA